MVEIVRVWCTSPDALMAYSNGDGLKYMVWVTQNYCSDIN